MSSGYDHERREYYPGQRGYTKTTTSEVSYQALPAGPKIVAGETVPPDFGMLPQGSRVGDKQRDRVVNHLAAMHGSGHLTAEELEVRRAYVMSAKTISQLKMAADDLPPMPLERGPLYDQGEAKIEWPPWIRALMKQVTAPWGHHIFRIIAGWVIALAFIILPVVFLILPFRKPEPAFITLTCVLSGLGAIMAVGMLIWTITEIYEEFDARHRAEKQKKRGY